jgi:WD40 repeat protein
MLSLFFLSDCQSITDFFVPLHASVLSQPSVLVSPTIFDFVVSSSISCVTMSLKHAYFALHACVMKVDLDDTLNSTHHVDTILSKFQPFTCLTLDPTDSYLAAACNDGTIIIYDINSQLVLKELSGHGDGRCTAFKFSPNMIDAVSSSDKGQLLVIAFALFLYNLPYKHVYVFISNFVTGLEHRFMD